MVFSGGVMGFYGVLCVFVFCGIMETYGDFVGFYGEYMGFCRIYLLVMTNNPPVN